MQSKEVGSPSAHQHVSTQPYVLMLVCGKKIVFGFACWVFVFKTVEIKCDI